MRDRGVLGGLHGARMNSCNYTRGKKPAAAKPQASQPVRGFDAHHTLHGLVVSLERRRSCTLRESARMNTRSRVVMFMSVAAALAGHISGVTDSIGVTAPSFHLGHQFGHSLWQRLRYDFVEH